MNKTIKIHGVPVPTESHTLITGLPGAGKTQSILRPLVKSYLSRNASCKISKVGMLLLDPKGDMLSWVRNLLFSLGRSDDLIVVGEGEWGFNFFSQSPLVPRQAAARLSDFANSLSRASEVPKDSEFWMHQQRQMIEAMIEVAQIENSDRPVQVGDICALQGKLLAKLKSSFDQVVEQFQLNRIPEAKAVFRNYANMPGDTRECVLATVTNCLSVFRQSPLLELMNPSAEKCVDLIKIIEEGKCVVASFGTRSYGNSTLPLLQSLKESFADIILTRPELDIQESQGWKQINQEREVLYVADEAHKALCRGEAGGELDFLDMCRENRCRAILATQSISSLQGVMGPIGANRLISLCGNHFYMSNIDPPTATWAHQMFAPPDGQSLPPPLLLSNSRWAPSIEWEGPQTLSTLKTGEFLFRNRDGELYRKKARLQRQ